MSATVVRLSVFTVASCLVAGACGVPRESDSATPPVALEVLPPAEAVVAAVPDQPAPSTTAAATTTTSTTTTTVPSRPGLDSIAVVGDSMSAGLAAPLRAALDTSSRTLEWQWWVGFLTPAPAHVWSDLLTETRPDLIVVFFAPWEREVLAAGGVLDPTDPEWVEEYRREHMDPWLAAVRASGSHLVWVSMPRSSFDVAPASHADLNAVWAAVASEEPAMTWVDGASVIDDPVSGFNEFDETADPPIRLFNEDGLHLCPAGTVRIADEVLGTLAEHYDLGVNAGWRSTDWPAHPGAFGDEGCDQPVRDATVPANAR